MDRADCSGQLFCSRTVVRLIPAKRIRQVIAQARISFPMHIAFPVELNETTISGRQVSLHQTGHSWSRCHTSKTKLPAMVVQHSMRPDPVFFQPWPLAAPVNVWPTALAARAGTRRWPRGFQDQVSRQTSSCAAIPEPAFVLGRCDALQQPASAISPQLSNGCSISGKNDKGGLLAFHSSANAWARATCSGVIW